MHKEPRRDGEDIANDEHNAWALRVLRENAVKAAEAATALQRPHEVALLERVTQQLQGQQEVTLSDVLRELGGNDSAAVLLLQAIVGPEDWARLEEEHEEPARPAAAAASKRPRTRPEHEPTESDGDDDDDDDENPEQEQDDDNLLLSQIARDIALNKRILTGKVPLAEAPDLERWFEDGCNGSALQDEQPSPSHDDVEHRLALLRQWWCLATRACQMAGLFSTLRREEARGQGLIQERYAAAAAPDGLKFSQAARYDRLGRFLLEWPEFRFQTKLVTLADWFKPSSLIGDLSTQILQQPDPSRWKGSNGFRLHVDGFRVYKGVMREHVTEQLVRECMDHGRNQGHAIFNNADVEDQVEKNDGLRTQAALPMDHPFVARIVAFLKAKFPRHVPDSPVVLLSEAGCAPQRCHTDYAPDNLNDVAENDEDMPLACLVVLMDGTPFDVWPGAIRFDSGVKRYHMRLLLNAGDVLIFRGDLAHAGAAFPDAPNVRVHVYMDPVGLVRQKAGYGERSEVTFFVDTEPYIVPRKGQKRPRAEK